MIVPILTLELWAEFKANVSHMGKENPLKLIDSTAPTQDSELILNQPGLHDTPHWWTFTTFKTCLHIKLLDRTKAVFWLQRKVGEFKCFSADLTQRCTLPFSYTQNVSAKQFSFLNSNPYQIVSFIFRKF